MTFFVNQLVMVRKCDKYCQQHFYRQQKIINKVPIFNDTFSNSFYRCFAIDYNF